MYQLISLILVSIIFIGCGEINIDIPNYQNRILQPEIVPDVCKKEYELLKNIPRVAVVKFTNNSSFSKANTLISHRNSNYAHAGIATALNNITTAEIDTANSNSNTNSINRIVDPKLDKAIASALEGSLSKIGGIKIYSRNDLNKIIKEQKLEQSGLFNEKTLAKVGKLAGVKYIVTGSIDSVIQEFKDYRGITTLASQLMLNNNKNLKNTLAATTAQLIATSQSGMKITTRATIKIINVSTGEIIFSDSIKKSKNIGLILNPTYTQIIGAIKYDLIEGIKELKPKLSQLFAPSGYILQIRSDKKHNNFIAQINLGTKQGIKPSQTFKVYKFDEITDPVTNKTICDKYTMNVKLIVSKNQIEKNSAWTIAKGDDASKLRPGQIIKRETIKNSIF
jgi:curli biogenesis system outer membrane secretion channel CsgG